MWWNEAFSPPITWCTIWKCSPWAQYVREITMILPSLEARCRNFIRGSSCRTLRKKGGGRLARSMQRNRSNGWSFLWLIYSEIQNYATVGLLKSSSACPITRKWNANSNNTTKWPNLNQFNSYAYSKVKSKLLSPRTREFITRIWANWW